MKTKKTNIALALIFLSATICWLIFRDKFPEHIEYLVYVLAVPLAFFGLTVFSKSTSEKPIKAIAGITTGVVIGLLSSIDFSICIFIGKLLATLTGAIITFFINKAISKK
jgi:NADH:ubiquinone oxidoreductase subunit 6 (subunit J)